MRLLISCPNSAHSLLGYDWDADAVFWTCPESTLPACGAAYSGQDLVIADDDTLVFLTPEGVRELTLDGPHGALAHSVHSLADSGGSSAIQAGARLVGLADTGNSRVLFIDKTTKASVAFDALYDWREALPGVTMPQDALHLNDFAATEDALYVSAFDCKPFRGLQKASDFQAWSRGGYGVIFAMTKQGRRDVVRLAATGLNHPHSLRAEDGGLTVCSSATGDFHTLAPMPGGGLRETGRLRVTSEHFLRGNLRLADGTRLLGGSTRNRPGCTPTPMGLYLLDGAGSDGAAVRECRTLRLDGRPLMGQVYDILPWDADIMAHATRHLEELAALKAEAAQADR